MEDIKRLFDAVIDLMKIPFTIYGFTISLWSIFVWVLVAGVVIWIIGKIFGGGD